MFKLGWNDGHTLTGKGTGAVGIIKETDRDRRIGKKVKAIFRNEYEIEIVDCTIDKSNNDMAEAVNKANNAKCDVFISNHCNKGGGVGIEGFYSRMAKKEDIEKGRIIYKELVNTKSCLADRRFCTDYSYLDYDLYVLKNTKMSAFLFEIGFIDNQKCVNRIDEEEIARAYVNGIVKAYKIKKKSNASGDKEEVSTNLKVGDRVKLFGYKYATGQEITSWAKKQTHTIDIIKGDRALLKEIRSWAYLKDLKKTVNNKVLKVGDFAKMNGERWATGEKVSSWVKGNKYKVKQIKGDRVLLDSVISWAYIKDLIY